ncbi:17657_t:CDS:2, partial [Funneliformis geosporum]
MRSKRACNAKTQGQCGIEKYYKINSNKIPLSERQSYSCQGLSNNQIKQYILCCLSDFSGSKHETELAYQETLSVTSAKYTKFTIHESKICEKYDKLRNNPRFHKAISV